MLNLLTRRDFARGAAATFGGLLLPVDAFGAGARPLVKFGVLSDVHINHPQSDAWLEKNLRLLDGMKVDAVIFPGDLSDLGYIDQLRRLAAVEEKVFPNGRAADGRAVKLMHTTGNHDIGPSDERAVWQGAFTSIGAGCAGIRVPANFGSSPFHANGGATYSGADMAKLMPPVVTGEGVWKDNEIRGSSAMMVELFKDHLVIHRISCYYGKPWGEDWCVPLPAAAEGPYDFKRRAVTRRAPQFAADAGIAVTYRAKAPAWAGRDWRGKKPCVQVEFPTARRVETSRVFDYDVTVSADGRELCRKKILSRGQHLPDCDMNTGEEVLFTTDEVPAGRQVVFTVVPHDCYGTAGRPLVSKPFSWVGRNGVERVAALGLEPAGTNIF